MPENARRGQFLNLHWTTPIVHLMARPLRLEFPGALYHLTSRGNAQQAIFVDDWDRQQCVRLLARIIHERFYCNRGFAAALAREASFVKREAQDGKSVSVSLHARYEIRFTRNALSGAFATNLHE